MERERIVSGTILEAEKPKFRPIKIHQNPCLGHVDTTGTGSKEIKPIPDKFLTDQASPYSLLFKKPI